MTKSLQDLETRSDVQIVLFLIKFYEARKGLPLSDFDEEALIQFWIDTFGGGGRITNMRRSPIAWPYLDGIVKIPSEDEKARVSEMSCDDAMALIYDVFRIKKEQYPSLPFLKQYPVTDAGLDRSGILPLGTTTSPVLHQCDFDTQKSILEHFKLKRIPLESDECRLDQVTMSEVMEGGNALNAFAGAIGERLQQLFGSDVCSSFLLYKRMSIMRRVKCCVFGFDDAVVLEKLAGAAHVSDGVREQGHSVKIPHTSARQVISKNRREILAFAGMHASKKQRLGFKIFIDFILCHFLSVNPAFRACRRPDYETQVEKVIIDVGCTVAEVSIQLTRPVTMEKVEVDFGVLVPCEVMLVVGDARDMRCIGRPCDDKWIFEGFFACDRFTIFLSSEINIGIVHAHAYVLTDSLASDDLKMLIQSSIEPQYIPQLTRPRVQDLKWAEDEEQIKVARDFLNKFELNNCKSVLLNKFPWLKSGGAPPGFPVELCKEAVDLHQLVLRKLAPRKRRPRTDHISMIQRCKPDGFVPVANAPTPHTAPRRTTERKATSSKPQHAVPVSGTIKSQVKRMCFDWLEFGICHKLECEFAHSLERK